MNPCDPYVLNRYVDENQLTMLFHTNDLIMKHLASNIVEEFIKILDKAHSAKDPLVVARGKTHGYLVMIFYLGLMVVAMNQCDFIKKTHKELTEDLKVSCKKNPSPDDFF